MQATYVDLDSDYVDDSGKVDPDDLDYRIGELQGMRQDHEDDGSQLPEAETQELRLLLAFRAEVERETGDFGTAIIVPEPEFERHVRYEMECEFGVGPDNIGDYVDWAGYAKDKQHEYRRLEIDGQVVWVR
jgi:hypothetical protein